MSSFDIASKDQAHFLLPREYLRHIQCIARQGGCEAYHHGRVKIYIKIICTLYNVHILIVLAEQLKRTNQTTLEFELWQ